MRRSRMRTCYCRLVYRRRPRSNNWQEGRSRPRLMISENKNPMFETKTQDHNTPKSSSKPSRKRRNSLNHFEAQNQQLMPKSPTLKDIWITSKISTACTSTRRTNFSTRACTTRRLPRTLRTKNRTTRNWCLESWISWISRAKRFSNWRRNMRRWKLITDRAWRKQKSEQRSLGRWFRLMQSRKRRLRNLKRIL